MPEAVVAMVEAQPALAACMEACMEVVQVLVLLKVEEVEHAVEPKERSAELAASAAAEAVQVLAACPMWAQARVRTSRRQRTSMLDAVATSTQLALDGISPASSRLAAF